MSKKILMSIIIIGCICFITFGYWSPQNQYTSIPNDITSYETAHPSRAFDAADKVKLSDFSQHIFIGTIEKILGTRKTEDNLLYTDATVRVINNLKGEIDEKRVIVSQFGGYNEKTKSILIMDGDKLFRKGETYVFYTSYVEDEGVYSVTSLPYGKVALTTPQTIKNKIEEIKIRNNPDTFTVENDYEINEEDKFSLDNSSKVKNLKEKIKIANNNPGIWKENVFLDK